MQLMLIEPIPIPTMDGGSGIVTGWQNKLQVALSRVLLETVMANQHAKKAAPRSGLD
jgi:hypothetical protein